MKTATNLVVSGCSARGMAVYLNCDHWAEQVALANPKTDVVCLAYAGWFPLIESPYNGQTLSTWFNGVWKNGYERHNASVSMHPQCLVDHNESTKWHCTLP